MYVYYLLPSLAAAWKHDAQKLRSFPSFVFLLQIILTKLQLKQNIISHVSIGLAYRVLSFNLCQVNFKYFVAFLQMLALTLARVYNSLLCFSPLTPHPNHYILLTLVRIQDSTNTMFTLAHFCGPSLFDSRASMVCTAGPARFGSAGFGPLL